MGCSSLTREDGQVKDRLRNKRNAKRRSLEEKNDGTVKENKIMP